MTAAIMRMALSERILAMALLLCIHVSPRNALTQPMIHSHGGSELHIPTITIFNDVPFHLEVVAGYVHALKNHAADLKIFLKQTKQNLQYAGFLDLVGAEEVPKIRSSEDDPAIQSDLLIMISPEYNLTSTKAFFAATQPIATILLLHEINDQRVADLVALHIPRATYMTLSPHTAAAARSLYSISVDWMLPVMPFTPTIPSCLRSPLPCQPLKGFVTQGVIDTTRRDFLRIWDDLAYLRTNHTIHEPVHVLGWGDYSHNSLQVPAELVDQVKLLGGLPFPDFYSTIYHSRAVLLYFRGGSAYRQWRFTSSVLTSLATGTPVVMHRSMLRTYKMLPRACVFVQQVGARCRAVATTQYIISLG